MRRGAALVGLLLASLLALPAHASAAPATFEGRCQVSGPIAPERPITLIPVIPARFSYAGAGTCTGKLNGAQVNAAPFRLRFRNVTTLFDTCELGPDINLPGTALIGGENTVGEFNVVVHLVRVALIGPFLVTTKDGGLGLGLAQFVPENAAAAIAQCLGPGLTRASLNASFNTLTPLHGVSAE